MGTRPLKVETPPSPLQQHLRFCRLAVLLDRSVHCNLWLFIATYLGSLCVWCVPKTIPHARQAESSQVDFETGA